MREFILFSRESGKELSRKDLIARCVTSALWVSHGLRDAKIHIVLGAGEPPKVVTFDPAIRLVSPDERSIIGWIEKVLYRKASNPGIRVEAKSFQDLIRQKAQEGKALFLLHEKGEDIAESDLPEESVFILGDHIGLPRAEEKFVQRFGAKKISLGKKSYLASHCIAFINITMDRQHA
jgi:tRNA (pseudouridine54-N1)-methyltransferase